MQNQNLPAYVASNEDLRRVISKTPNAKRVLTVAGSGDQALFYSLTDATTIDTYDITEYAGLIQDIKTAAVQVLNYEQYVKLINDIYAAQTCAPVLAIPELMHALPRKTADWITTHPDTFCFRTDTAPAKNNTPTAAEFAKLKSKIRTPFNFIHGDIRTLHTQLTGKYDVINLSNIFDTMPDKEQQYTLYYLSQFLTPDGVMLVAPQFKTVQYEIAKLKLRSGGEIACTHHSDNMYLFQRTNTK